MTAYEYSVVPAPTKGSKAKGIKGPEARFAHALEELMNEKGAEGWEYIRADTLPSVVRTGLTGSATHWRHVLVFRRALKVDAEVIDVVEQIRNEPVMPPLPPEIESDDPDRPAGQPGATQMLTDNGVEEVSEVAGVTNSLETLAEVRKTPEKSDV